MRRGEIRWYKFPPPHKRPPVVILTRNSALEFLGEVTVAPVTSTIRHIPTEVVLGRADGMVHDCAINLDHVQTVSRDKIVGLITVLSPAKLESVRGALLFALGFR